MGNFLEATFSFTCTNESFSRTEVAIAVQRGKTHPTGPVHLTNENAVVDTDWTTASGTGTYPGKLFFCCFFFLSLPVNVTHFHFHTTNRLLSPFTGFAVAALLTYKNLEMSVNRSFEELKGLQRDGVDPSMQIFSKVVSVVVSNPSTQNLSRSVNITLRHLQVVSQVSRSFHCGPTSITVLLFLTCILWIRTQKSLLRRNMSVHTGVRIEAGPQTGVMRSSPMARSLCVRVTT